MNSRTTEKSLVNGLMFEKSEICGYLVLSIEKEDLFKAEDLIPHY